MQSAFVAPDSTSLCGPMHPGNTIVVPCEQSQKVVPNHLVFVVVHIIDPRNMQADTSENTLPSSYRMRSDHWMNGSEFVVFIKRRSSGSHYVVSSGFGSGFKYRLVAGGRQCLQVGPKGRRHPIIAIGISVVTTYREGSRTFRIQKPTTYLHPTEASLAYEES